MVDVIIVYDTLSGNKETAGNTEKAASEVLQGVIDSGASVTMKKVEDTTESDLREARGIILGSPCVNNSISGRMRIFTDETLRDARVSGKIGAAFGTYKWNGGNLRHLEKEMEYQGVKIVATGVNSMHHPNQEMVQKLHDLGKTVGTEAKKLSGVQP